MNAFSKTIVVLNLALLAGASIANENSLPFCDAVLYSGGTTESAGNGCGIELPPPTTLGSPSPEVRLALDLRASADDSYFHFVIDARELGMGSPSGGWFRIVEVDTQSEQQRLAFEVARRGPNVAPKYRLVIETRHDSAGYMPTEYTDLDAGGSCLRIEGIWVVDAFNLNGISNSRPRLMLALQPSERCEAADEESAGGRTLFVQPLDAPKQIRLGRLDFVGTPSPSALGRVWVNLFYPLPWE